MGSASSELKSRQKIWLNNIVVSVLDMKCATSICIAFSRTSRRVPTTFLVRLMGNVVLFCSMPVASDAITALDFILLTNSVSFKKQRAKIQLFFDFFYI